MVSRLRVRIAAGFVLLGVFLPRALEALVPGRAVLLGQVLGGGLVLAAGLLLLADGPNSAGSA